MHSSSTRLPGDFGTGINDIGSLRLPSYTLANLSGERAAGQAGSTSTLYVKNLFDENPKLAIDRERGLRARFGYLIGQPRTIGLTVRKSFGARMRHRRRRRRRRCRRRRRRRRRLPGWLGDPGDGRLPAAAAAAAAAAGG